MASDAALCANANATKPVPISTKASAGTKMFGKPVRSFGERARRPLESSAITNRNSTKIAPLYTRICITNTNSALRLRYKMPSATKFASSPTTL